MENLTAFAKYRGVLELGRVNVDCYVSDNELRLISMRGMVKALSGDDHGDTDRIIAAVPIRSYLNFISMADKNESKKTTKHSDNADSKAVSFVDLTLPGTTTIAKCITHDGFLDICRAYMFAFANDTLKTDKQKRIAVNCSAILAGCAGIGLMALIDEATGYQQHRANDALQIKIQAYILDELRGWEKAFPDELWEEFGRLTNWDKPLQHRPKYWEKLVYELIYDALDPDVAEYLKTNKPNPKYKQNWHQWLSKDFGAKALHIHINQVVGIAKTCDSIIELKEKVAHLFKNKPLQIRVPAD